jgi:hypothetical protein
MEQQKNVPAFDLQVTAHLEESQDKKIEAMVYAYSAGGRLLGSQPLDEKGAASLKLPLPSEATAVRVVVGPRVEQPANVTDLLRRGAQETHLRIDPKEPRGAVELRISPSVWRCWILGICAVRGTLLKRVTSGGVDLDLPVCNARVEIFEVDPIWILIPRLPDYLLERLRDLILRPLPGPGPVETAFRGVIPRPGPGPDPATVVAREALSAPFTADVAIALQKAAASTQLSYVAQTGSKLQFQQALVANEAIIRPIFCYLHPRFVTMQKVGEAWTDDCGHFHTIFFKGCNNPDQPDLYFKAYQRIFGFFEVEIYGPTPIACHTWWDYVCGSEVTLYTTYPLAITCSPCAPVIADENWVLFTAIGNTSLKAIFGGGASGATVDNWGLTQGGAPWGGTLRPRLDFDNSLRESLGVKYYQLSWRRGTSGDWTPFMTDVYRHYTHEVGTDLVIEPYKLGPNPRVVGGRTLQLYEIPPAVPPIGKWTIANAVLDTENGELDTTVHSRGLSFNDDGSVASGADESGLFQFQLELFDAAGNLIDIAAKGIRYVVADSADLSGTIHTVNANTVTQPGGGTLMAGNALVLTLHVDNNHCWAGLQPPFTPSGTADACCGVVSYGPHQSVTLPYTAYHPHGFATYGLNIFRSATQILPTISGGTGTFSLVRAVSDMMTLERPAECLANPPCITAAFSEHLEVYAMATDGWGSYLGYNDVADRAFALAAEE